jgi:hypothetical protein
VDLRAAEEELRIQEEEDVETLKYDSDGELEGDQRGVETPKQEEGEEEEAQEEEAQAW